MRLKNNTGVPIVLDGANGTIRLMKGEVLTVNKSEITLDIQNAIDNGNLLRIEYADTKKAPVKGNKKSKEVNA